MFYCYDPCCIWLQTIELRNQVTTRKAAIDQLIDTSTTSKEKDRMGRWVGIETAA